MKRIIGSFAAVVLALSLGIAAYGEASPKQNNNAQTAPAKTSKKNMRKTKKRNTRHHRRHSRPKTAKSMAPKK